MKQQLEDLIHSWELELVTIDQLLLAAAAGSRIATELKTRRKQLARCVQDLWEQVLPIQQELERMPPDTTGT